MQEEKSITHYDLFVIGGGSGGLSCARNAAAFGAKVGLADFVKPSPPGTTWGLGGTCVNVGCIPKKLLHFAGLLGQQLKDYQLAGWQNVPQNGKHKYQQAIQRIGQYIMSLNFGYKKSLKNQNVEYYNKLAKFVQKDGEKNKIQLTSSNGQIQYITADKVLIATGGRPQYPGIPGDKQHGITSDDIFWRQQHPGKTLVVGASYIALQCAGFLHAFGVDVKIMVRSILLRGFDQHISNKIGDYMQKTGHKFIKQAVPTQIKLNQQGKKVVTYTQNGQTKTQVFDTVLFAIGRKADTHLLDLDKVGVKVAKNGKIIANDDDTTDSPNIFAIGDVVQGRIQLTPTAIMAGKLLAQRLFNKKNKLMRYDCVATTVFTPLEYGCVGYSQQDAIKKFGQENVKAYGSKFKPLQWNFNYDRQADCYVKLVCHITQGKQVVVGLHYLGPNAGQVVQGWALGVRMGATKQQFDQTVGIHPTCSEQFTTMKAIAGSADEQKVGC